MKTSANNSSSKNRKSVRRSNQNVVSNRQQAPQTRRKYYSSQQVEHKMLVQHTSLSFYLILLVCTGNAALQGATALFFLTGQINQGVATFVGTLASRPVSQYAYQLHKDSKDQLAKRKRNARARKKAAS